MENNKAVVYARYSSDKQTEQSIEGQLRECQAYAERKGIRIIGQYVDRALSGRMDARPDFQRMVRDSKKKLFDFVIVYQFDRFARDRYDSANYKHILKQNGVKVLSAKEDISSDPAGIMLETMLEGMAEYFSAELSVKVKRGMKESFMKGNYLGGGTTYGYDVFEQKYVINEKEAKVVRKVFEDYSKGIRSQVIRKWLKDNDIKTKRGVNFATSSLMQMLANKKYIGTLTFAKQEIEDIIPPIIDKAIFLRVQERIKKNMRTPAKQKAHEPYILSGKLFCAYCKALMIADSGTNHQGTIYRYYKCASKKHARNKECIKTQVIKAYLENLVFNAVKQFIFNDEILKKAAKQIVAVAMRQDENTNLMKLEKQLDDTQKQIENFLYAIGQGIITADTKTKMLELEASKADILYRIDGEKLNTTIKLTEDEVLFWLLQFRQGKEDDNAFRERLIDTFVNKVILYNDKVVIIFNIKGQDGEQISVDEIIKDLENDKVEKFEYEQYGVPERNRTFN